MIAVDTNVLVRLLVDDEPHQVAIAKDWLLRLETETWVGSIVMCEVVWVLRRCYGYGRKDISVALRAIVGTEGLRIEHHDLVKEAINLFEDGPADFPDYLIGLIHRRSGAAYTVTFDRDAAKSPTFRLLGARG